MEARSHQALVTDTQLWFMEGASIYSEATMVITVLMTSIAIAFRRALGSSSSLSTQSKVLVLGTHIRVLSMKITCTSLVATMDTIVMICISTTSRQTCGRRSDATACGQRVGIEPQQPCLTIRCIFLVAMMVQDS